MDGIFVEGKPALPQMKLMIRLRSAVMPDELRGEVWRTLSSTLICADAVATWRTRTVASEPSPIQR
jgi:hypothetical protein